MTRRQDQHDQQDTVLAPESPEILDERWITAIDAALKVQAPLAASYVRRLRAKKPGASRDVLLEDVSRRFTQLMTATGAGVGGVALLPGIGTVAAIGLTVGEGVTFAEACAFLTLSAAEIFDVDMRDRNTRRLVMLGVLGGERGERIIAKAMGRQGMQWDTVLAGSSSGLIPNLLSKQVTRYLRRKVVARAGRLWFGRLLPFGIGAAIGGFGARAMARSVVEAVEEIFAQAPGVTEAEVRALLDD